MTTPYGRAMAQMASVFAELERATQEAPQCREAQKVLAYEVTRLVHGEAVAAGMVCAALLAEHRRLITPDVVLRQKALLARLSLPTAPLDWAEDKLIDVMRNDKKALAGKLRFILPCRLGEVALFDDIPEADVRGVLAPGGS